MEANEICAICDDEFADEKELKGHVNKIHLLSTGPKRPSRSAPPPKKLANQVLDGYDGLDRHYFIRKETHTKNVKFSLSFVAIYLLAFFRWCLTQIKKQCCKLRNSNKT